MTRRYLAALIVSSVVTVSPPASAGEPDYGLEAGTDDLSVWAEQARGESIENGSNPVQPVVAHEDPFEQRMWTPVCLSPDSPANPDSFPTVCGPVDACAEGEQLFRQWGLNNGVWVSLGQECRGDAPEAAPAEVTPAIVLRALRRMGLPEVQARTQPEGTTLVNFDTIFYAEAGTQTRDVTLLGRPVTIEATPAEFTWHHGDGTSRTTTTAGAPYPAKDVVHRYARATGPGEQFAPRVDVSYTARFRIADGPWREIGETVTISGPPGALDVTEATPALTGASTG